MTEIDSQLNGAKVFVTGAGGFIGSHLVERLIKLGANVTALVRYNSRHETGWLEFLPDQPQVIFGDIRDRSFISKAIAGHDYVFHLAALISIPWSYEAVESYFTTNVNGTINILEAIKSSPVKKLVTTSTSEVYGTAIKVPIDELHPLQPQSPYSASKISADMIATAYAKSYQLPISIVRPFNTYGPRQLLRAIIPSIMAQLIKSDKLRIGDMTPVRDFNYVSDTVAGFISTALNGKPDATVYNLASGKGYSIEHVLNIIARKLKITPQIIVDKERIRPAASEVYKLIGCATKANDELGWESLVSLDNGLSKTLKWIQTIPQNITNATQNHK